MDIFKIQELSEQCEAMERELQDLTAPRMTDIEQVERIFTLFTAYCDGAGVKVRSRQGRRLFVAVIFMLYSPLVFVGGGRMVKGLRSAVQRVVGYQTPEAVSVCIRSVVSEYLVYAKFRNDVDAVCSYVEESLTASKDELNN